MTTPANTPIGPRSYYPLAGVVVYDGETVDQAFERAAKERARSVWQQAAAKLAASDQARPWWEDPIPEGRT